MTRCYLNAVAIAGAISLLSGTAFAKDPGGFYLEAFGGASMLQEAKVNGNVRGKASFKTGPVVGAALGYDYADSPFRWDLEYAYRSGDAKTFAGGGSGDFASVAVMLNAYYDFDTGRSLTPYVGVGAGFVPEIDWDIAGGASPGEYSDRGGFAWQVMGGLNYAVTDRIGFAGELRYFDAGRRTLTGSAGSIKAEYGSFDAVFGVRYRFGARP